jgi:hypothetical protein
MRVGSFCLLLGGLLWLGGSVCAQNSKWERLLARDPFAPDLPPPPPPPELPPPPLELRGVLVEGGVTWFNVFNGQTKESAWVRKGEQWASFVVQDYDRTKDALTIEISHRKVTVALKQSKMQLSVGGSNRPTAVASLNAPAALRSVPAVAAPLPASEAQRLETVAMEIRERREQRKRQMAALSPSST